MEAFSAPDATAVAAASLWTSGVHTSEIDNPCGVSPKALEHAEGEGPSEEYPPEGFKESTEKPQAEADWKCHRCLVVNAAHEIRCPCCEGPKPGFEAVVRQSSRR